MPTTEETLTTNISATIRKMKKDGTTGASMECLKQNTPTKGLTCPVPEYHNKFPLVATEVAKKLRFTILKDTH